MGMQPRIIMNIIYLLAGLFIGAGIFIFITPRLIKENTKILQLKTAYFMELIIVAVILIPTYFGGIFFKFIMGSLALLSTYELARLNTKKSYAKVVLSLLMGMVIFIYFGLISLRVNLAGVYLTGTIMLILVTNIVYPLARKTSWLIGIYPCIFLTYAVHLREKHNGLLLIIFLYVISESFDAFASIFGKLFGKKSIFPNLSPGKTYAGFYFGTLFSLLIAFLINNFTIKLPFPQILYAALLTILFTVLGDLVASKIKRQRRVKDFGNVLPFQGGVLDIYDAFIFSSPMFYYFVIMMRK